MTNFYRVEDTYSRTQTPKFSSLKKACEYAFRHRDSAILGRRYERMLVTRNDNFNLQYAENFEDFTDFYKACIDLNTKA